MMLGGQAGTPGRSFSHPVPLASLQGGQGLTDAWTAHMFICEPHPLLRGAGNAFLLIPLAVFSRLWVSVAIIQHLENCRILEQKDN